MVDDAGWADFEDHDVYMRTPNILKLKQDGVYFSQSYTMPMCVVSRAALMSGKYPHTFGLQNDIIGTSTVTWLNDSLVLLPEELQQLGYKTHMLGKWHLGHCHPGVQPLGRGFDTQYGFMLGGHASYYTHIAKPDVYDWWDGSKIDKTAKRTFQTKLLTNRAVKIIEDSEVNQPFFMYLSYGAVHSPQQVPGYYENKYCSHVPDEKRRTLCGMMALTDEGVGKVVTALKDKGIYDKTAILFISDNGGIGTNGSYNWPLRGSKKTLYDGGIRTYTVLKTPRLSATNVTWTGLIHMIDWFPTLLTVAGGKSPSYTHGKNMWWRIKNNLSSYRKHILYVNDFQKFNHAARRYKQWKLIGAIPGLPSDSKWMVGFGANRYPPFQEKENATDVSFKAKLYSTSEYLLYDLENDPNEITDLATDSKHDSNLEMMKKKLKYFLSRYPLQPLPATIEKKKGVKLNGALATCWCQPPTKSPCPSPLMN